MEFKSEYYYTFGQYCAQHPEIKPEWEAFVGPVVEKEQDEMFKFIMGYII